MSRVLLIPSLAIAPIVHRFDHHKVQIICHPVTPAVGDPDVPPPILLQLTRALADERGLRILRMVAADQLTAVELAERLETSLTTLTHHLDLLRAPGLVVANRPGRKRYRSNPEALRMLHELLGGHLMPAGSSGTPRYSTVLRRRTRRYDLILVAELPETLRVALLTYRGNPRSGGQGVYVRNLSRSLAALGHRVEVLSGQPYPDLDSEADVTLTRLPSLDLYRPDAPFKPDREVRDAIDLLEFTTMCSGGFPEPLTFSLRAWRELRRRGAEFDVVHDNQCLGYGLLALRGMGLPVLATIHHPIRIDRRLEMAEATGMRRIALRRWYAFTRMQARVARRLPGLLTVSEAARDLIVKEMGVRSGRIAVVPNGVDAHLFRPHPERPRKPGRIVATASADVPLKGLAPLLRAFAQVRARRPAELVVVGKPRPNGPTSRLLAELDLDGSVRFVNGLADPELVSLYAEAEAAVVPSLYEGFSLPAAEAMACGLPLVATTAGALPEVVGPDREAALLVPPGDVDALARGIVALLADGPLRRRLGDRGRSRVLERFTWEAAARATAKRYREIVAAGC